MNVVTMAGVPKSVVDKARTAANEFEKQHKLKDSTWTGNQVKVTPSVLADLGYLMSSNTTPDAIDRIVKGLKRL
jgi:DNA mismatch repair protein MSH6